MGGPRASTERQVRVGVRCSACAPWLGTPPSALTGQPRRCDRCEPRPHRILLNFGPCNGWAISFLADDPKTSVGRRRYVQNLSDLEAFVSRAGADMDEFQRMVSTWGQGGIWLNLTDEQYARLLEKKQPGSVR